MPGTATPAPAAATPAAPAADPNVIDVQATEVPADKDFADAFAAATSDTPAASAAAPTPAAPAVGTPGAADAAATPAPAAGATEASTPAPAPAGDVTKSADGADGAAAPAAAPAADGAAAAASPASNAPAASGPTVESLQAEIAALKAAQAQAPAPAPAAAAPAPAEQPLYTDDEKAVIAAYKTEWSDVAAGEALIRREENQKLVQFVFDTLRPHIEKLYAQGNTTHERTQYSALRELVPDYDTVREPTLAWIAQQPEYLKNAYQQVANSGTPEQVADIINRFRKETGWVAQTAAAPAAAATPAAPAAAPAAAATPAPAAAPAAAVSPAVAAAAAALKPVGATRTAPTTNADPNDFDGAFAEAAKALGQ